MRLTKIHQDIKRARTDADKCHLPESCDTIKKLNSFLSRRRNRKDNPVMVQLESGPYANQSIPMTTDSTITFRIGAWYGYYDRHEYDQQNRRMYGHFLSNAGYRYTGKEIQRAKWCSLI